MKKLYSKRDYIQQGIHYMNHVSAMTSEKLHSKSDIAAELAHRDIVIEDLFSILCQLLADVESKTNHKEDIMNKILIESTYKVLKKHGIMDKEY